MKRRTGRGVLIATALLFAASAALRLGGGLGGALAAATDSQAEGARTQAASDCAPTGELAAALSAREARLRAGEQALAERRAAIELAEEVTRGRIAALEAAEAELRKTLAIADGAAEGDLGRLTAVYEAMRPREAAVLFDTMEPQFAAGFLGRMRPETAAAILASMTPERAYAASAIVAGRNARAPTE